ncbi:MAG: LLM class flavin-dependent oxidoreductase [Actinobacteria bacterium]|nr:LLM class flavin-dependent oxidoreductase [Actinomycetota bacterium]
MAAAGAPGQRPRVGLRWDPRWDPLELPEIAQTAEQLGYDELWTVEDCFSAGGLTSTALALAATEQIEVGLGLLPAIVRNPAIAAMELAVLGRAYPGRFLVAFGHGVSDWMQQIGARPANRMPVLEETVEVVRALLRGETLTVVGNHVELHDVVLEHPPAEPPPILIGTTGPRGLELAGRAADGIIVVEVACPAAVEWARATAGPDPGRVIVYCFLSLDDDDAAGIAAIRPQVEAWMKSGAFPDMAERAGIGRDGSGPLSDDLLQTIAAAGSPASCRRTIEGLWAAGADSVVLLPRQGDGIAQYERFGREVLPALRESAA